MCKASVPSRQAVNTQCFAFLFLAVPILQSSLSAASSLVRLIYSVDLSNSVCIKAFNKAAKLTQFLP